MLDAVSCWEWNWNAISAVATAAAAIATAWAAWSTRKSVRVARDQLDEQTNLRETEQVRQKNFSIYLLSEDLNALDATAIALTHMAIYARDIESGNENESFVANRALETEKSQCIIYLSRLRYLNSPEQKFLHNFPDPVLRLLSWKYEQVSTELHGLEMLRIASSWEQVAVNLESLGATLKESVNAATKLVEEQMKMTHTTEPPSKKNELDIDTLLSHLCRMLKK